MFTPEAILPIIMIMRHKSGRKIASKGALNSFAERNYRDSRILYCILYAESAYPATALASPLFLWVGCAHIIHIGRLLFASLILFSSYFAFLSSDTVGARGSLQTVTLFSRFPLARRPRRLPAIYTPNCKTALFGISR